MNGKHDYEPSPDKNKTYIYLVRHGLTQWNVDRRFQGQLNVPLNEEGLKQAEAVASWLEAQPVKPQIVYSSDLTRAAQTASAIANKLRIGLHFSPELREIHCGEWQGLSAAEVEGAYPGMLAEWDRNIANFCVPGGESIPQVQERIVRFYRHILETHRGQVVLFVSHGAALSALIAGLHGWQLQDTWSNNRGRMGNAAVTLIEADPDSGENRMHMFNSVEHLPRPTGMVGLINPPA